MASPIGRPSFYPFHAIFGGAAAAPAATPRPASGAPGPAAPDAFENRSPRAALRLSQLPPDRQAQYQRVEASLAGYPRAQQALENLLAGGRLTGQKAERGGGDLLSQLDKLADPANPMQPGVDRGAMLSQVVKDVADPSSIRQGGGNNKLCGATTALADLAGQNPAEYARLASGLARNGHVTAANGDRMAIQAHTKGAHNRSATQRLMAPALQETSFGKGWDVRADGVAVKEKKNAPDQKVNGTYAHNMERMEETLTGENHDAQYIPGGKDRRHGQAVNSAQRAIADQIAAGEQPTVKRGKHWFLVTGFDQASGKMTVQDQATGTTREVNAKRWLNRADAVTFDLQDTRADRAFTQRTKKEDPGGGYSKAGGINPIDD
jgi:hypothetical protein